MRRWYWLTLLLAPACSSENVHPNDYTIELRGEDAPVALMGRLDLAVADACQAPTKPCTSGLCCTTQTIENVQATADNPIAAVQIDGTTVSITPTAPGMTNVRITGTLAGVTDEKTRAIRFLQPDRMEVDAPQAIRMGGREEISACLPPVRMEVGARGYVPYRAYAGAEWLVTTGMQPFALEGNAITLGQPGGLPRFGFVYFDAATPGTATMRATIGDMTTIDFETVSRMAIDGIDISPVGELVLPASDEIDVDVFVTSGGRRLCGDMRERVVVVETPSTCRIAATQSWPHDGSPSQARLPTGVICVGVQGMMAGTCRIRAGVVDTALEDVIEVSVR